MNGNYTDLRAIGLTHLDNPNHLLDATWEFLALAMNGEVDIVDCSNPTVFLLESSVTHTCSALDKIEQSTRNGYASLSVDMEGLYRHMGDKDFEDIFAVPGFGYFRFIIEKSSYLKALSVNSSGVEEVVFAKDTVVTVGESHFQFDRALAIQGSGQISVVQYPEDDTANPSDTSVLDVFTIKDDAGIEYIIFDTKLRQLLKTSSSFDVTNSVAFEETMEFTGDFCQAKLYRRVNGSWSEIDTTFADQRYDISKPIVLLKVVGQTLTLSLSPSTLLNQDVGNELLAIVYSTDSGVVGEYLTKTTVDGFQNQNLLRELNTQEAAVSNIAFEVSLIGTNYGGQSALSEEALRSRIISNSTGTNDAPVTNNNMVVSVKDYGYDLISLRTQLNQQEWIVSSGIADIDPIHLGIGIAYESIRTNMDGLEETGLLRRFTGSNTLLPELLIDGSDSTISNSGYVLNLRLLNVPERIKQINNLDLRYSPLHYQIVEDNGLLSMLPYQLTLPTIDTINIRHRNDTGVARMATQAVTVNYRETGYQIRVGLKNHDGFEGRVATEFFAQLSWVVNGVRVFIPLSVSAGVDYPFIGEALIPTEWELDGDNIVVSAMDSTGATDNYHMPLNGAISIYYGFRYVDSGYVGGILQEEIYSPSSNYYPVAKEDLTIKFGTSLPNLYRDITTVGDVVEYETYSDDVIATNDSTAIRIDNNSPLPFTLDSECRVQFKEPTYQNDPILDQNGDIVYLHRKGDFVLQNGQPVVKSVDERLFDLELMTFDAKYLFATDPDTINYVDEVLSFIQTSATTNLSEVVALGGDHTQVYYRPSTSVGKYGSIERELSPTINVYVADGITQDETLVEQLQASILKIFRVKLLSNETSVSRLTTALEDELTAIVTDINITGMPEGPLSIPENSRFNIKKKLYVADNGIGVTEDIVVKLN